METGDATAIPYTARQHADTRKRGDLTRHDSKVPRYWC